jgi:hypothetical protein
VLVPDPVVEPVLLVPVPVVEPVLVPVVVPVELVVLAAEQPSNTALAPNICRILVISLSIAVHPLEVLVPVVVPVLVVPVLVVPVLVVLVVGVVCSTCALATPGRYPHRMKASITGTIRKARSNFRWFT